MHLKATHLSQCTTRNDSTSPSHTKSTTRDYGHWRVKQNHRIFFDSLAVKLNITQPSQWYKVTVKQVKENGGGSLLNLYKSSLSSALESVYPEYTWKRFLFAKVPKKFWESDENVVEYLKWVMDQFGIKNLQDWETVSKDQLLSASCGALLNKKGGLKNMLQYYFPELHVGKLEIRTRSKVQTLLELHVVSIFQSPQYSSIMLSPGDIVSDYRHPDIVFPGTNRSIEFDIYIPKLKIAIDYQGERHYIWTRLYGDPTEQKRLDSSKRSLCEQHGIYWIEIPFWWNRRKESIVATLHHYLPQLITSCPTDVKPLQTEIIPEKYLQKEKRAQAHLIHNSSQGISKHTGNEPIRYQVSTGQLKGALSKCKGCKKQFHRGQLRLEIQGAFTPMGNQNPIPAKFSSCLSFKCIQKIEADSKKPGSGMFLPHFQNVIGVHSSISRDAMKNESLLQENPNLQLMALE